MASFISNITKSRRKSPEQLVKLALRAVAEICSEAASNAPSSDLKGNTTPQEDLCKRLSQMKSVLYGEGEKAEVDEERCIELSKRLQEECLMLRLIENLSLIPFEARKDTAAIFNNVTHKDTANFTSHISQHPYIEILVAGYDNHDIALNCGSMLRECCRYDELTSQLLRSDSFWRFFDIYVHLPNFDIASDAFNTLRDVLAGGKNKQLAADFLESRYEESLLQSSNYVTRRRSLKLLGELLLDRSNFSVMIRYISSEHNLQLIMNLLRDKSPNIQFEAFHVFKVFVANPKKPQRICVILYNNRDKLMRYLQGFHAEKDEDDAQFCEEKKLLLDTLAAMENPMTAPVDLSQLNIQQAEQASDAVTPRSGTVEEDSAKQS